MPTALYFEDLTLGATYTSHKRTLGLEEQLAFARDWDPQPMHLDAEAAQTSPFGKLVGSGWHTLCTTIRLMVEAKPFGDTPLLGMQVDDIRFHKPLLAGMTLHAVGEVVGLRPSSKGGRGYVQFRVTTYADGEVIATQQWTMLVPGRPAAD
jgi:acyl dehydratase